MAREIEVEDPWWTYLLQGVKKVEGRKASPKWVGLTVGQKLTINCKDSGRTALFEITRVTTYDSLEQYLVCEGLRQTLPGKKTLQEGIDVYLQWSTQAELAQYKFLGIEIQLIPKAGATRRVLGALALSISHDWNEISDRYHLMVKLSKDLGRDDLVDWLEKYYTSICYDGRIIERWGGLLGKCKLENLESLGLDSRIFPNPHQSIEDYTPEEDPLFKARLSIRLDYIFIEPRCETIKDRTPGSHRLADRQLRGGLEEWSPHSELARSLSRVQHL